MSSADDPKPPPLPPAADAPAPRSAVRTLREVALVTILFCVCLAAIMGAVLARGRGSSLARQETSLWVCGAFLLGAIALLRPRIDTWFRAHRGGGFVATGLICAFAAWFALSPNLGARFGVIDDHQIIVELTPGQGRLRWSQWPERFRASEAFSFGSGLTRYRPAAAAFFLAECCGWGREVPSWYRLRIALCAAMLLFLVRAAAHGIGTMLALSVALALLGTAAIADTYCRLGPSEAYGMTALALGAWALVRAWRGNSTWAWWISTTGFALASMFKENFVPLAAIACVMGAVALRQRRDRARASRWGALAVLAALTAAMLFVIARMLLMKGQDVYGNQIGAGSFVGPVASGTLTLLCKSPLTALWPLLVWTLWALRRPPVGAHPAADRPRLLTGEALIFLVTALAAWFSQVAFYRDSEWPPDMRYGLPGIVVPLLLLGFGAVHLVRVAAHDAAGPIVLSGLFCGLVLTGANGAVAHVRSAASTNAIVTRHFSAWVDKVAAVARAAPERVIVLAPERPFEHFEPMKSVAKFLLYRKVTNPIRYTAEFLRQPAPGGSVLEKGLHERMARGQVSPPPSLLDASPPVPEALYVPFGTESAAGLRAKGLDVYPLSFDEAMRKPSN